MYITITMLSLLDACSYHDRLLEWVPITQANELVHKSYKKVYTNPFIYLMTRDTQYRVHTRSIAVKYTLHTTLCFTALIVATAVRDKA